MRLLLLTFCLCFLWFTPCFSQTITVIDNEDLKPIPDVAILNKSGTSFIYTNRSGKADISSFSDKELICFQNFTFDRLCLTAEELKEKGYEVRLTRKIFALSEFVISANRWEQNVREVPNKIVTVLKPEVQFYNPQTAADLIALSNEVYVQKSQMGGGSPMIRGFATNRVLIVVDGVRMNNAIYREGNIHNVISLDPSVIESTEIIFGPGATVYGSDAIGGVMDFHTKKALYSTGEKAYIKADALSRLSSANKEKTFHFDFNAGTKKWAFLTSISWSEFDHMKMGSVNNPDYTRPEYAARFNGLDSIVANTNPDVQVNSAYKQLNTMNKLRFKPGRNTDVVFTNHYSQISDIPRYDRLIQYKSGKLRYGDWYYGPQVWLMNNLQITNSKSNKIFDEVRIIAAHQRYQESRHDRSFGKPSINEQFEDVTAVSLNIDFDKKTANERELLYYGVELVYNDIKSEAQTRDVNTNSVAPAGSRYPNGVNKWSGYSVYAGYKNNISELLTFNTGIRYNYSDLYSTIADNSFYNFPFTTISISNGAVTGAAGIVARPGEKLKISLNASTGFRAPNLDDAGKVFDSAPGIVVVPNPDLEPEYAWNADLGISKEFGNILHADITAFYTLLTNAMIRHDYLFNGEDSIMYGGELSKVEAMTNAGSARVYGLQVNIQVNMTRNLHLTSTLNLTEGKESNGSYLRHAAPLFGSTHLVFDRSRLKADLYSSYNGSKKYEKMPPSETEKAYMYAKDENGNPWSPGWITLNFKISYAFCNRIFLNAGVENIFDQRYRPYSSGIVAPGRNFILSLRVTV